MGFSGINLVLPEPLTSGSVHARVRFMIEAMPPSSGTIFAMLGSYNEATGGYAKISLDRLNCAPGDWCENVAAVIPTVESGDSSGLGYFDLRTGHWFCVLMEVDIGEPGAIRFEVDGDRFAEDPSDFTSPLLGWKTFSFGVFHLEDSDSLTAYFDDVVVDTAPLSCD
jgi:hypothetical protein